MDRKHELNKARKWGMTKWVRPIMDIMMDGTAGKHSLPYNDCQVSKHVSYVLLGHQNFHFIDLNVIYSNCGLKVHVEGLIMSGTHFVQTRWITN